MGVFTLHLSGIWPCYVMSEGNFKFFFYIPLKIVDKNFKGIYFRDCYCVLMFVFWSSKQYRSQTVMQFIKLLRWMESRGCIENMCMCNVLSRSLGSWWKNHFIYSFWLSYLLYHRHRLIFLLTDVMFESKYQ